MATNKGGRPKRPRGATKRTIPIDDQLFSAVKDFARRNQLTLRSVIERGLTLQLQEDTAVRTDASLSPMVDRVIQERHKRLEAGLRTMMVRVAFEVLRSQYIWLNFMTEAGITPGKVDTWREQGWHFAIKEFRRQPDPADDDER